MWFVYSAHDGVTCRSHTSLINSNDCTQIKISVVQIDFIYLKKRIFNIKNVTLMIYISVGLVASHVNWEGPAF